MQWRRTLIREFQALADPPLGEDEAAAAYFQMKSFVLGHSEARRLLGDPNARASALSAFRALLDRTAKQAANAPSRGSCREATEGLSAPLDPVGATSAGGQDGTLSLSFGCPQRTDRQLSRSGG